MKHLALLYLVGLSISIVSWTFDVLRFNIFLISIMAIISLVQFFRLDSLLKFPAVIAFYCTTALFPLLHLETYRISTIMFTGMFCCSYMFFIDMLYKKIIIVEFFECFLRYLVYAYFVALVMQQIGVLTGTWIINKGGFDEFSITKLNSLSTEPSSSTMILFLAVNSDLVIQNIKQGKSYTLFSLMKDDPKLFFAYSYSMLTMGSVTGILMYALSTLSQTKLTIKHILLCFVMIIGGVYIFAFGDFPILERSRLFFKALFTLDPEYLLILMLDI